MSPKKEEYVTLLENSIINARKAELIRFKCVALDSAFIFTKIKRILDLIYS